MKRGPGRGRPPQPPECGPGRGQAEPSSRTTLLDTQRAGRPVRGMPMSSSARGSAPRGPGPDCRCAFSRRPPGSTPAGGTHGQGWPQEGAARVRVQPRGPGKGARLIAGAGRGSGERQKVPRGAFPTSGGRDPSPASLTLLSFWCEQKPLFSLPTKSFSPHICCSAPLRGSWV